jgi:hypothetical protein
MDDYPEHLAPEFEESGAVKTPFGEWWSRVKDEFPNVPEIVAKDWLHRHWRHSPFSWIPSRSYEFSIENYPAEELTNVLNRIFDFEPDGHRALEQGKYICGDHPERPWRLAPIWLVQYMRTHGNFPSPIIILDNSDNHLVNTPEIPSYVHDHPQGLILAEGHTRHEIGLYLHSINQMNDFVSICRLKINPANVCYAPIADVGRP